MNSLVAFHRSQVPNDPRSDAELTLLIGDNYPGVFDEAHPDFKTDYDQLSAQRRELLTPSLPQEFGRGVRRGVASLESTFYGAGALASAAMGADDAKKTLLEKAREKEEEAAANAPTIRGVEDIHSGSDALRYALGQTGELAPNLAETVVTAGIGAVAGGAAGTAVEPGGGTVVGAGGGLLAGIIEKQAIKSLLKKGLEKLVENSAERQLIKTELEQVASGTVKEALSATTKSLLGNETKAIASRYGGEVANLLNFYAQSAGGLYSKLAQDEKVDPDVAINTALLGGFVASVPAQFLPNYFVRKVFQGVVKEEVKDANKNAFYQYFANIAAEAAKTIPGGAAAMNLQELANIAAEKYADPAKRGTALDEEDFTKLKNATAMGVLAGAVTAPASALFHGSPKRDEIASAPSASPVKEVVSEEISNYTGDLSASDKQSLSELAQKDVNGQLSLAEKNAVESLPLEQKNYFTVAKDALEKDEPAKPEKIEKAHTGIDPAELPDHLELLKQILGEEKAKIIAEDERRLKETLEKADWQTELNETMAQVQSKLVAEKIADNLEQRPAQPPAERPRNLDVFRDASVAQREIAPEAPSTEPPPALDDLYLKLHEEPHNEEVQTQIAELESKENLPPVEAPQTQTPLANVIDDSLRQQSETLLSKIGFDTQNLVEGTHRTGKKSEGELPAREGFFEIPEQALLDSDGKLIPEQLAALGEDLVSRARFGNGKNTDTRRITAFESPDGTVVLLPTYYTNAKERGGKIYRVGPLPGKKLGSTLEAALGSGYKPLASFYLNETINARDHQLTFPNREQFNQLLRDPAREQMTATRNTAAAVAAKMTTDYGAPEENINATTPEELEQFSESGPSHENLKEPEPLVFSNELAAQIYEDLDSLLDGTPINLEAVDEVLSDISETSGVYRNEIGNLIFKLVNEGHSHVEASEALKGRLIEAYQNGGTSQSFVSALSAGSDALARQIPSQSNGERSKIAQPSVQPHAQNNNRPGEAAFRRREQAGSGGEQITDRSAEEIGKRFSTANSDEIPDIVRQSFDSVVRRLSNAGVSVQIAHQLLASTFNGVYDRTAKAIAVTLRDATAPTTSDFRVLIEEAGHHVFAELPAEEQTRIQQALAHMSDEDLGITDYTRNADAAIQAEERLMAAVSQSLVRNGFDPIKADGLANAAIRFVKELYLKAAIAIQTALFGPDYSNPELARRYFQNRLESFLSGDQDTLSFIDRLGGGKPTVAKEATWHPTSERLNESGGIEYESVPDTNLAAVRFNLRFSTLERTRTVEIEKRAALYNHQIELIHEVARNTDIVAAAKAVKIVPDQLVMKTLGLSNPIEMKKVLATAKEPGGQFVQFDPSKRIDGFKGKANIDQVTSMAYRNATSLLSKIGRMQTRAAESLETLKQQREKLLQRYDEDKRNYANWEHTAIQAQRAIQRESRRLFNVIAGVSKRQGVVEQLLRQLDPLSNLKEYAPAFQKLFTGDQLKGEKLFNVLERLALDSNIDFSQSIIEIKRAMQKRDDALHAFSPGLPPEYALLLQNTKESRALFATVVAFAKTHEKTMVNIELRREKNGQLRVDIAKQADELKAKREELVASIRDLNRTSKLEERYRKAHIDSLSAVRTVNRRIARAESLQKVANAAAPVFAKAVAELSSKLDLGADATWGHEMPYNVPENPTATNSEILKATKKVQLDSSRAVTNPAELEADLHKMAAFLNYRGQQYAAGHVEAKDNIYQGLKRQFQEIALHKNFTQKLAPSSKFMIELAIAPVGRKIAEAFGTPAARLIDQMINVFTSEQSRLRSEAERVGRKNDQFEDALLKFLPSKLPDKREYLRHNFLNPAKRLMQSQHDLEEIYADDPAKLKNAIYGRVEKMLLSNEATKTYLPARVRKDFMVALRKQLEFQHESNQFLLEQVEKAGTGVLDPKLKVINPATGQFEAGVRRHIAQGAYTFSQTINKNFRIMVNALRNSGWELAQDDFSKVSQLYKDGKQAEARTLAHKYFNHPEHGEQVQKEFFRALVEMDTESPFDAPEQGDGIRTPADIAKVLEAYDQSNGDPIAFSETLHQLHGGKEEIGNYIQSTLLTLAKIYHEADGLMEHVEPRSLERTIKLERMTSPALINARSIEHLPGTWFDYHSFDQRDMMKMVERIASQTAFGRNQARLAAAFETVRKEVDAAKQKLAVATAKAKRQTTRKDVERKVIEILGKDEYRRVKQLADRSRFITDGMRDLSTYFRRDNNPDGTLRAMTRLSQSLGSLMVNQPSSAIAQLAALFDMNLRYGASKSVVGATAKTIGAAGKEMAASLAQAIGIQIFNDGYYHRKFVELGLTDAAAVKKWNDALARWDGESRISQGFRGVNDLLGTGINPLKERAEHTVLRPVQPFVTSAIAANKALTEGIWHLATQHVTRGMEFFHDNPDKFADPRFKLSVDHLKITGLEKDSFIRLTRDFTRWGLDYDEMVRSAIARREGGENAVLTNEHLARLYSMMLSEVSSESNLSSMSLSAYNNSLIRFATPLIGWSFRRMNQIAELRLNEEGRNEMKSLARGLAGLAVISAGGLAMSGLVNQYYQDLVGKERNLRPASDISDPLAVLENLNRVGTFGLFGEVANSIMNVGQGADNRMLSVDQRVLAFSSLQSIQRVISAWLNQDFNADYTHVVRPLASAVGGGGLLQYIQIANHAFGLDNAEARTTARLNAQNYLRVAGRELEMDVRTPNGGYNNPTPLTPYLTQMELAMYANSPADFQSAYSTAVAMAKDAGYADPVDHVKRAFASRNPLKSVFRTAPSEAELQRLLAALPDYGRRDVSEALRLFHHYGQSIGITEDRSTTRKPARESYSLDDFRARTVFRADF